MASVFDDIERTLEGGADHLISQFDYLNASDRVEAARVRQMVDDFLQRYPEEHQAKLRGRLRSRDDTHHVSAFYELAMHEALLRAGCKILAIEPKLAGTSKSPDFLVQGAEGHEFYFEATLANERSQQGESAKRRLDEVLHTIDSVESKDFFLGLSVRGTPAAPVARRKLKAALQSWLAGLSYDGLIRAQERKEPLPQFLFEEHGLTIRITPSPRHMTRGQARQRAIAIRTLPALSVQPQIPIKNALAGKATRYGKLDLPFVVAVNAMGTYSDHDNAIDALFGTPAVVVRHTIDGFDERFDRVRDGVWVGNGGPTNTRLSAVVATVRLTPWSLAQHRGQVILNPWAAKPLASFGLGIDGVDVVNNRIRQTPGRPWNEIFGLAAHWPEEE